MTTKHTLGPWEVGATFPHCVFAPDGKVVANATGQRGDIKATANARLIAAAPDYAAATERLLAVFDQQRMTAAERIIAGVSDAGLRTEGNAAIEALRAAQAKATGQ